MLAKCSSMNPAGIRIAICAYVVGELLWSFLVWGVEDQPGVEVSYVDVNAGGCVKVLSTCGVIWWCNQRV